MIENYGIPKEKVKKIIFGYVHTNGGVKKLSWFYDVDEDGGVK